MNIAASKYFKFYKSIAFEREGLFELIQKEFNTDVVMYPGCSIHITPSFYFSHVVYLDKSEKSVEFFSDNNGVTELIQRYKNYTKSTYWRFISGDVKETTDLKESTFDLLISLFSEGLLPYCLKYLKPGGVILTNCLDFEQKSVEHINDLKYIGIIKCRNFKYSLITNAEKKSAHYNSKLRQKNDYFEYIDKENYYLYRKNAEY